MCGSVGMGVIVVVVVVVVVMVVVVVEVVEASCWCELRSWKSELRATSRF